MECPYIADLVQYDILNWEWAEQAKKYKQERYMGSLASLSGLYVKLAQQSENFKIETYYISGWLGQLDYDTMLDMIHEENKTKLMLEDEPNLDLHLQNKNKAENKP